MKTSILHYPKASLSGRGHGHRYKFAMSAFQHDDPVTLNAHGHGHNFIDRIQHLTSHKVLGKCDDLGSSP
jgi:hypothetical protein